MSIEDPALEIARLKTAEKAVWPAPVETLKKWPAPPPAEKLKKRPAMPDMGKLKDKLKPWRPVKDEHVEYETFTPQGMTPAEVLRYLAILAGMIALALLVD